MADYLLLESNSSITEQREIFALRRRKNPMPANRGILEYYQIQCGEILNNCHIFKCHKLNQHGTEYEIDKFHNGFTIKIKQYLKI